MSDFYEKQLTDEQKEIIESTEKYMIVSACPGSGKTFTLVSMLKREIEQLQEYQGVVACSFTNEASDEIKKRLGYKLNLEGSFIGTIDSFVKYIISMYVNRALDNLKINHNQVIIDSLISLQPNNFSIDGEQFYSSKQKPYTFNDIIKNYDKNAFFKDLANQYYKKEWMEKLLKSSYEVSFSSYLFAIDIVKMSIFKDWFNNHFKSIYIDEAQDLNIFQHCFFSCLKSETKVRIIMLGDPDQSIYQFRGAKPNLFNDLKMKGYTAYQLSYSYRCNKNIIRIANRIAKNKWEEIEEELVFKIQYIDYEFLMSLKEPTFILTDSNNDALTIYNKYRNSAYDVIYSKRMELDENFSDYKENSLIIDELIKYYYNFANNVDKYKYPFMKIEAFLKNKYNGLKKEDFDLKKYESIGDFLKKISALLSLNISNFTIDKIMELLNKEEYRNYYQLSTHKNRIMTIHSSKGLESDNVIIYLTNMYDDPNSEAFKNKLFVAITRARKRVYILSQNNTLVSKYIDSILI